MKRPKKISEYSDLSFLYKKNRHELLDKLSQVNLTEDEKEKAEQKERTPLYDNTFNINEEYDALMNGLNKILDEK